MFYKFHLSVTQLMKVENNSYKEAIVWMEYVEEGIHLKRGFRLEFINVNLQTLNLFQLLKRIV